jgi:pyruvate/2-oxoglutarate dehydrogenase complex dihydrolipoamide acyltransferase (E2) component
MSERLYTVVVPPAAELRGFRIARNCVDVADTVITGQPLVVLDHELFDLEIPAPCDGVIVATRAVGAEVASGDELCRVRGSARPVDARVLQPERTHDGPAALQRLLSMLGGEVHSRDALDQITAALSSLASTFPELFLAAISEGERLQRSEIVWALGGLDDPRAIEPLIHALEHGRSWDVRWAAAHGLRGRSDERGSQALARALHDTDSSVRFAAAAAAALAGR